MADNVGSGPAAQGRAASLQEWSKFMSRCIATRLEPDTLDSYVGLQQSKYPLPPVDIADVFLRPLPENYESLDPRVPRYIEILTRRHLVDTPSILAALYKYSTSHTTYQSKGQPPLDNAHVNLRWGSSYASEEVIFYRLSKAVNVGTGINNAVEAIEVCKIMAKWMSLFTAAAAVFTQEDLMGQVHTSQSREEMDASRAAFIMLFLSVCDNQTVLATLSQPIAAGARKTLSESLANFAPSMVHNASQIAARLEHFRTEILASFESTDTKINAPVSPAMDDMLDSTTLALDSAVVPDIPITNTRAGLYIYLNAALVGRPLIDDNAFFNYLHNKYQGDVSASAIDLILASFDVLANAVFRNEGQKVGHLLRSYLINKVPIFLVTLASFMSPPLTPQYCIKAALDQVDQNAFPTLSSMFEVSNNSSNTFTESVRQDFCFACCLHGLIPESSIEGLLGEITYQSLPPGGRYVKQVLVDECMKDPDRIQGLINELENMDGNVGAVSQALTEVIGRLCSSKETMTLKSLCTQLAKKPLSLDVMLLFDKPATVLHPLCDLLDNWRYEEDQGEYQPVYEEFGSVLLLVLTFVHRYGLSKGDLAIRSPDSFTGGLVQCAQLCLPLEELSEQQKIHLDGWIRGLFDNEAGGLGDELMSSCPPQEFYKLVPTLFSNIVAAVGANYLDEETLKTGIEYLVDTFLLPSLVIAITSMCSQLWVQRKDEQRAIIRIFQLILLTKQGSTEAQAMMTVVVNTVAKPLEHALRAFQRQEPKNQDIEPLLKAFRDNVGLSRRTAGVGHNELESWTSANGSLAGSIRHRIQGFVQWSLHPQQNMMPALYTHRQILTAMRMPSIGRRRLLDTIVDETKAQTEQGNGPIAHDVAVALICAPDVTDVPTDMGGSMGVPPQTSRQTLRAALKDKAEDFKTVQKTDPVRAEILIRLHRKVEQQLHMPQPDETMIPGAGELTGLEGLDENSAAAAASFGDAMAGGAPQVGDAGAGSGASGDAAGADMDMGGAGGSGDGTAGGLDLGGADDIFGDLGALGGSGADLLEGWDSMDLS